MGLTFSKIWQKILSKKIAIIIVGLDSAGKTTILYKINLSEIHHAYTIGFNYEYIQNSKLSIMSWDLGGYESIRPLRKCYYENVQCLVFVVDSTDRDRIYEVYTELQNFLSDIKIMMQRYWFLRINKIYQML